MTTNREKRQQFVGLITFRPSRSKVSACLSFITSVMQQRPELAGLDKGSILLLAEASHLSAYGRPVTGCRYDRVECGWRPELLTQSELTSGFPILVSTPMDLDGANVSDDLEITFPDLSKSDMDHMLQAALALRADPETADRRLSAMLHDGQPDYALMLEDTDPEMLEHKLEDLAGWSRYFYFGPEDD